jgi:hypothetical protein
VRARRCWSALRGHTLSMRMRMSRTFLAIGKNEVTRDLTDADCFPSSKKTSQPKGADRLADYRRLTAMDVARNFPLLRYAHEMEGIGQCSSRNFGEEVTRQGRNSTAIAWISMCAP